MTRSLLTNYRAGIALLIGIILVIVSYTLTDDSPVWHSATHESGFALIVAVIIYIIFELATRGEDTKVWNNRIDRISRNVFFSVLGKNMSQEYIVEAQTVALDNFFERREFYITYILTNSSYIDRNGCAKSFVRLNAMTRFKLKNVSTENKKYSASIGLPNPIINELKPLCKIDKAEYRRQNEESIKLKIDDANKKLQEDIKNDDMYQITVLCGDDIILKPGEEIEIKQDFTMAKEDEDTEIVQTLYPTTSIIVTLHDSAPEGRIVRARGIHRLPIDADLSGASAGIYIYRMEKPILPYQGFAVFWKRRPGHTSSGKIRGGVDVASEQGET